MGGQVGSFPETIWTQILQARGPDRGRRRELLGALVARYWKPIYCYLRRKGHDNATAKDLTQGFIHEVVLGRDLAQRANPAKGRFRTYLLTALDRYCIGLHRRQTGPTRRPAGARIIDLDRIDPATVPEPSVDATAEEVFTHEWVKALLARGLDEVEAGCRRDGKMVHWNLFRARVLAPITQEATPPPMDELCAEYDIANRKRACNMIITVKRRFQTVVGRLLSELAESQAALSDEIHDLMNHLAGFGAAQGNR